MRECYTGRLSNVRRADVFLQYLSAPILGHNDGHHRALGHPSGRPPRLPALPLALSPSARRRLPCRLCVPGGASPGPRWRTRHLARWSVPRAGPCAVRRRGLPPLSHPLLARRGRRHAAAARLGWRRPGALAYRRRRPGPRPPAPLDVLPVAQRRRPGLPLVPVGRAAARDRVAGDTVRARPARPQPDAGPGALALDALADVVAAVPPRVPPRRHGARERGRRVAPSQPRWRRRVIAGVAPVLGLLSLLAFAREIVQTLPTTRGGLDNPLLRAVEPIRSVNGYGLFRVMTTERPEIVIEGSRDGVQWSEYGFRWKPGDVHRRPAFVAPHMPRLDWQMWFAALNPEGAREGLPSLLPHVLTGTPEVLALLGDDPFPDAAPRYVRLADFRYPFSKPRERAASGAWWQRERVGDLMNPACLSDFAPAPLALPPRGLSCCLL